MTSATIGFLLCVLLVTCLCVAGENGPEEFDIRLTGGNTQYEGLVEIYKNGYWTAICDDYMDFETATVLCRMLGHAAAISYHCCAEFGEGDNWDQVFDGIRCEGHEQSIEECYYRIEEHNYDESMISQDQCDTSEDVGLTCDPAEVRLRGGSSYGPTMHDGRVEILHDHAWMSINAESMDFNLAVVLCRMLDYHTARSYQEHEWTHSHDRILNGAYQCTGDEDHFNECTLVGVTGNFSDHPRVAGLSCISLPVRLNRPSQTNEGEVQVFYEDWNGMCLNSWGMAEANVTCRMLGFDEGALTALHVERSGGTVIESVECDGTESNLAHCNISEAKDLSEQVSSSSVAAQSCDTIAAVRCKGEVSLPLRLSGGADESEGRVEMFHYGSWGTMCARSREAGHYGINTARVICQMLGYPDALDAKCCGHYGPGVGGVFMSIPSCTGKESHLLKCPHSFWYSSHMRCNHFQDFGVACQKKIDLEVRLVGGNTPREGRVELLYQDSWGTVCDDNWDLNDANVVCRMLGYERAESYSCCSAFGEGSGDIIFDDVECDGSEVNIGHCPRSRNKLGVHDCTHSEDVGVKCFGPDPGTTVLAVTAQNNNIDDVTAPGSGQALNIAADRLSLGLTISLAILFVTVNVVILVLSIRLHRYRRRNHLNTDTLDD